MKADLYAVPGDSDGAATNLMLLRIATLDAALPPEDTRRFTLWVTVPVWIKLGKPTTGDMQSGRLLDFRAIRPVNLVDPTANTPFPVAV